MKLKWYDWDGVGDPPTYVEGVRLRGGIERIPVSSIYSLGCMWIINKDDFDIIAYTLGEKLEDENSVSLNAGDTIFIAERGAVFDVIEPLEVCGKCCGDNFIAVTCCGGHECGCMGQPIDFEPCDKCNKDGNKDPDIELKKAFPFFFKDPLEGGE